MPRHTKHIHGEEEEEQLTIDTYMTVFWPELRGENRYIDDFLLLCNRILNIDLSNITEMDYNKMEYEYTNYFKKINRFAECVNILLSNRLYQKYKLYKNSYLDKIEILYKHMLSINLILDQNAFLEFMYKNTVEGRIVAQNSATINDLEIIEATRDHLILIHDMLYPTVVTKSEIK